MYTKNDKIIALLTGRACEMIEDAFGDKATTASYNDFFRIDRNDINEFVKNNGVPKESYKTRSSLNDGHYLLYQDGQWCVYYQERNIIFAKKNFRNEKKAIGYLITLLLNASGTGIEF